MKKIVLILIVASTILITSTGNAQRQCGNTIRQEQLQRSDPAAFAAMRTAHKEMALRAAGTNPGTAAKGTSTPKIAVVFHYVLTPYEFSLLGGATGLKQRADSQIAVLNRDYNEQNPDSTKIPGWFKPYYGNVGVRFGLATKSPTGAATTGVEYKILATGVDSTFSVNNSCYDAKFSTSRGLNAWDVTKYINIWVCNIIYPGPGYIIFGVTTPPSDVPTYATAGEVGMALNFGAVGKRQLPTDYYLSGIDLGRTCTHEMGHFFELYHTWGDDGGHCPGDMSGGQQVGFDDDISDTPPEADNTYGVPGYTVRKYDLCSPSGTDGIMFMNYMDYVDDQAMQMFTHVQADVMRSNFIPSGSESYSLTQHPELLAIDNVPTNTFHADVYPNPTTSSVVITLPTDVTDLQALYITNALGQTVAALPVTKGQRSFTANLSAFSKGLYIIHCQAQSGTATEKLLLQ